MKTKSLCTVICTVIGVCVAALIWVTPCLGEMESQSYRVPAQVLDGGGSSISSGSFRLNNAIGQSTPAGVSQSTGLRDKAGFIPQITGEGGTPGTCTITFNFIDQSGNLSGTGNERIYVNGYGWKADGEHITVEPGTSISYRVYYRENTSLCGPWLSYSCTATATLSVEYHTLAMDFEDQSGDLNPGGGRGTGDERVYIDQVGYKADGEMLAVPLNSTISFCAYFKQGSGLGGTRNSLGIDGSAHTLLVRYQTLTADFEDQDGDLNPGSGRGTGDERVLIDYVGYKADAETITLPLGSAIGCRAYFKQDSVLYGSKSTLGVDGSSDGLPVHYYTITMNFADQSGDLDPAIGRGTGNERVSIDYVGYKADAETVTLPLGSTIGYRAYFKQASGIYGPKSYAGVDGAWHILTAQYFTVRFDILDSGSQNPVPGAQLYVDNAGYVQNGGFLTVPLSGTIYHRANVGSVWSTKTSKKVDSSWTGCIYLWNGVAFGSPAYL